MAQWGWNWKRMHSKASGVNTPLGTSKSANGWLGQVVSTCLLLVLLPLVLGLFATKASAPIFVEVETIVGDYLSGTNAGATAEATATGTSGIANVAIAIGSLSCS